MGDEHLFPFMHDEIHRHGKRVYQFVFGVSLLLWERNEKELQNVCAHTSAKARADMCRFLPPATDSRITQTEALPTLGRGFGTIKAKRITARFTPQYAYRR